MKPPVSVHLPKENNNDETAKLLQWLVASGSRVTAGQAVAEFETSKTGFELHAPCDGIIQYRHKEGEEIEVGGLVCLVSEDGQAAFPEVESKTPGAVQDDGGAGAASIPPELLQAALGATSAPRGQRFSRAARGLLAKHGLGPEHFAGRGLIRSQDVLRSMNPAGAAAPQVPSASPREGARAPTAVRPAANVPCRVEEVPRSKHLEISLLRAGASHVLASSVTLECPTRGLRALAEQAQASLSAALIYEVGRLLRKHPAFNGFFAGEKFHFYEEVRVGFALDAGLGLKVPVLRDADKKSLAEIDQELRDRMAQYLNDELPVESLSGGTFTITDLGQEGATFFSPLINQGQSAILGLGADGPDQGWFHLTLAFDHQMSNGREATQFLRELGRRLAAYERAWSSAASQEPYCHHCERTLSALQEFKACLLEEISVEGERRRVCSLCLRGL